MKRFIIDIVLGSILVFLADGQENSRGSDQLGNVPRCERIDNEICQNIGYSYTHFPNDIVETRSDAELSLESYAGLLQDERCAKTLKDFLCSAFMPECSAAQVTTYPCRSTCKIAKINCRPVTSSFVWPEKLNCDRFPISNCKTITAGDRQTELVVRQNQCAKLDEKSCLDLGYNMTFIRDLGAQWKTVVEFRGYNSLFQEMCPQFFRKLSCLAYFPVCTNTPMATVLPCRSDCEKAKAECEAQMNTMGIKWPKKLNCKRFPRKSKKLCMEIESDQDQPRDLPGCQRIESGVCQNIGYNFTRFPNNLAETRSDAELSLESYAPLMQDQRCAKTVKIFLCSAFLPECSNAQVPIYPCRSTCEIAKRNCEPLTAYFVWPEKLNCDKFPISNCKAVEPSEKTAESSTEQTSCEEINISQCRDIGYTKSHFPNPRAESQRRAEIEIQVYYPLLEINCSPVLQEFLCSVYAPECTDRQERVLPCRSLCESSKAGCEGLMKQYGFSWPQSLNCTNFPTSNCRGAQQTEHLVTTSISVSCEPITIPMCQNVGYNASHFPNPMGESQSEVGLQLQGFYPLIKLNCSPHLQEFLCSAYVPECSESREAIPPCRSLCESSMAGCSETLEHFGFSWPNNLDCSIFPTSDCRDYNIQKNPDKESDLPITSPRVSSTVLISRLNETSNVLWEHVDQLVRSMTGTSQSPERSALLKILQNLVAEMRKSVDIIPLILRILEEEK